MDEQDANSLLQIVRQSPHVLNPRVVRASRYSWHVYYENPYNAYTVQCSDAGFWKLWSHGADNGWLVGQPDRKP